LKTLADALVYSVVYINVKGNPIDEDDCEDEDADVGALESIAGFLSHATDEEKDALAAAANRALAAEKKGPKRKEFIRDYSTWMEDMFMGEWEGNKRV
jgi:hypothetical protein